MAVDKPKKKSSKMGQKGEVPNLVLDGLTVSVMAHYKNKTKQHERNTNSHLTHHSCYCGLFVELLAQLLPPQDQLA
jgi:hypothetical protein